MFYDHNNKHDPKKNKKTTNKAYNIYFRRTQFPFSISIYLSKNALESKTHNINLDAKDIKAYIPLATDNTQACKHI